MDQIWTNTPTDIIENISQFVDDIDVRRAMGGRPRKLKNVPCIQFPKTMTEMWFRDDGSWYAVVCIDDPCYLTRKWVSHSPLR